MFKIVNGGKLPTKASKYSACVDLYANKDMVIGAGETVLVPLGVCIDERKFFYSMPGFIQIAKDIEARMIEGEDVGNSLFEQTSIFIDNFKKSHFLQLMIRSSISKYLIIANGVGVIDLDYPGEIMIRVYRPYNFKSVANVAIKYVNILSKKVGAYFSIPYFKFDDMKLNEKGSFIISIGNKEAEIDPDRIAQITLLEHKAYLFGIESKVERTGGFGSTGSN